MYNKSVKSLQDISNNPENHYHPTVYDKKHLAHLKRKLEGKI
jgi:hypothetical protein